MLGSWISSETLGGGHDNEVYIAHAIFIHWCDGNSIKADALAMMVDIVGANDGSELVVHCMADLLAATRRWGTWWPGNCLRRAR